MKSPAGPLTDAAAPEPEAGETSGKPVRQRKKRGIFKKIFIALFALFILLGISDTDIIFPKLDSEHCGRQDKRHSRGKGIRTLH
ncbi:MAG: hypothetical protein AB2L26_11715 [Ignavibacteria bacterium]